MNEFELMADTLALIVRGIAIAQAEGDLESLQKHLAGLRAIQRRLRELAAK